MAVLSNPARLEIAIVKFTDPVTVWVRDKSKGYPSLELQELTENLTKHFYKNDGCQHKSSVPLCKEKLFAVRHYKKGIWARGLIKNEIMTTQGEQVHVFLVDSAESINVPHTWIRILPEEFIRVPVQVFCIVLPNLHPIGLQTQVTSDVLNPLKVVHCLADDWDSASHTYVSNILREYSSAYLECSPDKSYRLIVEVRGNQFCLNDKLVSEKYATPCIGPPNCPHRSCQILVEPLQIMTMGEQEPYIPSPSSRALHSPQERQRLIDDWHAMQRHLDRQLSEPGSAEVVKELPSPEGKLEVQLLNVVKEAQPTEPCYVGDAHLPGGKINPLPSKVGSNKAVKVAKGRGAALLEIIANARRPGVPSSVSSTTFEVIRSDIPVGDSHNKTQFRDVSLYEPGYQTSNGQPCSASNHVEQRGYSTQDIRSVSTSLLTSSATSMRPVSTLNVSDSGNTSNGAAINELVPPSNVSESDHQLKPSTLLLKLEELRRGIVQTVPTMETSKVTSPTFPREASNPSIMVKENPAMVEVVPESSLSQRIAPAELSRSLLERVTATTNYNPKTKYTEGYKNVFVYGESAVKPMTSLLQISFAICIKRHLKELNYKAPIFLQDHVWPEILRGRHVAIVGRSRSGKTLGYLLPLLTLILKQEVYKKTPAGNGPLVLILCSSLQSAQAVYKHCYTFAEDAVSVVLVCSSSSERQLKGDLAKGCDIIIATPNYFLQMLKEDDGRVTNMMRLCHLVVDDAHILMETHTQALSDIVREYRDHRTQLKKSQIRNCLSQMIICGETWTPGMNVFYRKFMMDPVVYISSMLEASIFSELPLLVHMTSTAKRDDTLIDILGNFTAHRIVICTSSTKTAENICELLQVQSLYVLVIHGDLTVSEVDHVIKEWHTAHSVTSHPILVVSDNRLADVTINNANCLIHYDLPPMSKGLFDDRFAFLLHGLRELQNGCSSARSILSSQVIITEDCAAQAGSLVEYLSRLPGVKVPKELVALAAGRQEGKEECAIKLCDSWKAFGRCHHIRRCMYRHTIDAIKDAPRVPNTGEITLMVTCVINATHYYARLLRHHQPDGQEINLNTTYWKLTSDLNRHYAKVENRLPCVIKVGTYCGYLDKDGGSHRILVQSNPNEESCVKGFFMDIGSKDIVSVDKLFHLPIVFQSIPPQAVEVYLCNVLPVDNNPEWNIRANTFVYRLIHDKELVGKVRLALGNTLWVNPLCKPTVLGSVKVTLWEFDVAEKLIAQNFACKNPQHLDLIQNRSEKCLSDAQPSCAETVSSGMDLDTVSRESASSETLPEGPLSVNRLQCVFVSVVESPKLFYVQKEEFADRFDELSASINEAVFTLSAPEKVDTSELYLAPFPPELKYCRVTVEEIRDDGSLRVFSVDFGDYVNVSIHELRILPLQYRTELPYQAVPCALAGVEPVSGTDWPAEVTDMFYDMVMTEEQDSRQLTLRVSRQLPAKNRKTAWYEVFLYDRSVNSASFNDFLVQEKKAVKTFTGHFPDLLLSDSESVSVIQSDSAAAAEPAKTCIGDTSVPAVIRTSKNTEKAADVADKGASEDGQQLTSVKEVASDRKTDDKVTMKQVAAPKVEPCSVAAPISWHQTAEEVVLTVVLNSVKSYNLEISCNHVQFSALAGSKYYSNDLDLYAAINEENKRVTIFGQSTTIRLPKIVAGKWPRLLKESTKVPWLSVNFDHIDLSSDSSEREARLPPPRRKRKDIIKGRSSKIKPAGYYQRKGRSSSSNSDDVDERGEESGPDDYFKI